MFTKYRWTVSLNQSNSLRGGKSVLLNCFDCVNKFDLGGESVPMIDERHPVRSVPAVEFDAAAAHAESPYVGFHRGLARELISCQVPKISKITGVIH